MLLTCLTGAVKQVIYASTPIDTFISFFLFAFAIFPFFFAPLRRSCARSPSVPFGWFFLYFAHFALNWWRGAEICIWTNWTWCASLHWKTTTCQYIRSTIKTYVFSACHSGISTRAEKQNSKRRSVSMVQFERLTRLYYWSMGVEFQLCPT